MISRTFDHQKIVDVLTHKSIWPCIADGDVPDGFSVPLSDDIHYLHDEGTLIVFHKEPKGWQIHVNVIPEFRATALGAVRSAMDYAFREIGADVVFAEIPEEYQNVYRFALKVGMRDAGIINGDHCVILERSEWVSLGN